MSNGYERFYRRQAQQQHPQLGFPHCQQQYLNSSTHISNSSFRSYSRPNVQLADGRLAKEDESIDLVSRGIISITPPSDRLFQELKCKSYSSPDQRLMPPDIYPFPYYSALSMPSSMNSPRTPFATFDSSVTDRSCTVDDPHKALSTLPPWCSYEGASTRFQIDISHRVEPSASTPSNRLVEQPVSLCDGGKSAHRCAISTDIFSSKQFCSTPESDIFDTPSTDRRQLVSCVYPGFAAPSFTSLLATSPASPSSEFTTRSSLSVRRLSSSRVPPRCVLPNTHSIVSMCSSGCNRDASIPSTAATSGPCASLELEPTHGTSRTTDSLQANSASVSTLASVWNRSESHQATSVENQVADDALAVDTVPTLVDIDTLLQAVHSTAHRCSILPSPISTSGIRSKSRTSHRRERGSRQLHEPAAVKILRAWYDSNQPNTVADQRTLEQLAKLTGLTPLQIRKWLYNMRYRLGQTTKHQLH